MDDKEKKLYIFIFPLSWREMDIKKKNYGLQNSHFYDVRKVYENTLCIMDVHLNSLQNESRNIFCVQWLDLIHHILVLKSTFVEMWIMRIR